MSQRMKQFRVGHAHMMLQEDIFVKHETLRKQLYQWKGGMILDFLFQEKTPETHRHIHDEVMAILRAHAGGWCEPQAVLVIAGGKMPSYSHAQGTHEITVYLEF